MLWILNESSKVLTALASTAQAGHKAIASRPIYALHGRNGRWDQRMHTTVCQVILCAAAPSARSTAPSAAACILSRHMVNWILLTYASGQFSIDCSCMYAGCEVVEARCQTRHPTICMDDCMLIPSVCCHPACAHAASHCADQLHFHTCLQPTSNRCTGDQQPLMYECKLQAAAGCRGG